MNDVWLIGAGNMAIEYARTLANLSKNVVVIGRGKKSAKNFKLATGIKVLEGGVDPFLKKQPKKPQFAIVAVNINSLKDISLKLIIYGIKNILIEKPGGLNLEEIEELSYVSKKFNVNVFISYNRRFYQSVGLAKDIIKEDGGVSSFSFDFTELLFRLDEFNVPLYEREKLLLYNSSHVIDLAFHLCGLPKNITCFHNKNSNVPYHKSSSVFSGSGITSNNSLFSYKANWESAGRWELIVNTKNYKLTFCPLEELRVQKIGSFDEVIHSFNGKNDYDAIYKPGIYMLVKSFLDNETRDLCSIEYMKKMIKIYYKIGNYN
tara:strand:- start:231 stop:1187 length:957 start_codon:yes stop_codon:yes gene_type:complete